MRQPSPEEYESVRQNQKAIVLFRLTGSVDSKEIHVLVESLGSYPNNYAYLSFGLANLNAGEPLRVFFVKETVPSWLPSYVYFSPSPELAESGWGAFLLEPGPYYLRITSSPKGVLEPIPEFRFTVPPNVPLVYIGSLHVACTTIENAGLYWGRGFGFRSCSSDATAANEDDAAKLVAQASFRELGPPLSAIMQRYASAPLPPGTLSKVAPVGLLVPSGKIDVGSPEWMRRAMSLGLAPTAGLLALGVGLGQGGALFVIGGVLWAPVGTVLGYLGGKWSESSWEPCRQALRESISKFNPMASLGAKLKAVLDHWGVQTLEIGMGGDAGDEALGTDSQSILSAQITRVALDFCSPTLCLDVATHAWLFDVATQTYVYDRVFVYSAARLELQPYELSLFSPAFATSRPLEAYCEEGGGEILQADLSNALDATVNQIVRDLGLRVEDGEPDR